jgi:hypothetical protein
MSAEEPSCSLARMRENAKILAPTAFIGRRRRTHVDGARSADEQPEQLMDHVQMNVFSAAEAIDILRCPFCWSDFIPERLSGSLFDVDGFGTLTCECGIFPVIDGIPVLDRASVGSRCRWRARQCTVPRPSPTSRRGSNGRDPVGPERG